MTAIAEKCTGVTACAHASTRAGLSGEGESIAGEQAGIRMRSGAIREERVRACRGLPLYLRDDSVHAPGLCIAGSSE